MGGDTNANILYGVCQPRGEQPEETPMKIPGCGNSPSAHARRDIEHRSRRQINNQKTLEMEHQRLAIKGKYNLGFHDIR